MCAAVTGGDRRCIWNKHVVHAPDAHYTHGHGRRVRSHRARPRRAAHATRPARARWVTHNAHAARRIVKQRVPPTNSAPPPQPRCQAASAGGGWTRAAPRRPQARSTRRAPVTEQTPPRYLPAGGGRPPRRNSVDDLAHPRRASSQGGCLQQGLRAPRRKIHRRLIREGDKIARRPA